MVSITIVAAFAGIPFGLWCVISGAASSPSGTGSLLEIRAFHIPLTGERLEARSLRGISLTVALAAAAAALYGCASSPSSQAAGLAANLGAGRQKSAPLPGKPGCFWLSNFDGSWTVLNDSELIVYAALRSKPYLIQLFTPVPSLRFHERLGFADSEHTGMICNGAMDDLVVPHSEPHHVPILAVRELTMPEARRLLVQNHIKPPPGPRAANASPPAKP